MSRYAGLDPDLNGAIAFINILEKRIVIRDIPQCANTTPLTANKKSVDVTALTAIIKRSDFECLTFEQVGSRGHTQAAKSIFSYGVTVGLIFSTLQSIPEDKIIFIHPRTWHSHFKLTSKYRDASALPKLLAKDAPNVYIECFTPRGRFISGRADAFYLAYYGLRKSIASRQCKEWDRLAEDIKKYTVHVK